MTLIRCTKKLLNELNVNPSQVDYVYDKLYDWHANLLLIQRKKCILLTNSLTLYSVFIPELKRADFNNFSEVFYKFFLNQLKAADFSHNHIKKILKRHLSFRYTKTNNRSVLGSMNDLVFQIKIYIKMSGGLENTDCKKLNNDINQVPMSFINYKYSIDVLKELLK